MSLKSSSFHLLLISRLISLIGDEIFMLGFPLYIFHKTNSVQQFGFSLFVEISIYMIFSLIGGVIADRWDLRKVVIKLDLLSFLSVLLFGYLLHQQFSIGLCYLLLITISTLSAMYNVSFDKLPVQYLENDQLSKMLSYFQSIREFSKIIGAPLGGIIFYYFGIRGVFACNAVSFLIPIFVLMGMGKTIHQHIENSSQNLKTFFSEGFAGFGVIWNNPLLRMVTILAIFLNIPLAVYAANWPILYKIDFGVTDKSLGFIQGICAIFFVMASLFAGRRLTKNLNGSFTYLILAQIIAIVGSLMIFAFHDLLWAITGAVLLSVSNAFHGLPSTYIRTQIAGKKDYGKVLAAARVISRIFVPLTIALATLLLPIFSVRQIMGLSAVSCLLFSILPAIKITTLSLPSKQAANAL